MSYGFDLLRLPAGIGRRLAYSQKLREQEKAAEARGHKHDPGPFDSSKEHQKQRLAAALIARHPTLEMYRRDYAGIAHARGIDEAEARRLFRTVELNERNLSIQIQLFDDAAGASFSFVGDGQACTQALRILWDCLEILESEGGFSTYDTQLDRILDLKSDFKLVLKYACGIEPSA